MHYWTLLHIRLMLWCFTILWQEPDSKVAVPSKKKPISASKNGTAAGPVAAAKKVSDSSSSDSSDDSDSDEEIVSTAKY